MDKKTEIEFQINQLKNDYNNEWWRPSKIDNYELKNKVKYN